MERRQAAEPDRAVNGPEVPSSRPLCSIVIPSYNGRKLLERCLASIERHRPHSGRFPIEVVVVDNGSTDGTTEWLSREHPGVRFLEFERNLDFCGAANAGLDVARGDFIQLLNNDTEVTPGWIEAGLAPFEDPNIGSVAPLVVVLSEPGRVDSAGDNYAWYGWPLKRGHGQPSAPWSDRPIEEVFGASGASAFYRAEALRRTGPFDMLLVSYYEDIDLAFRLRWAGYRCVFNPSCVIRHDISATYDHRSPALQRRIARNAELVFWWNLPTRPLIASAIPHLAFVAVQAGWRLVRGRARPFLAGKLDAVRMWREIRSRRRERRVLVRNAPSLPHFALSSGSMGDVRNHLNRPAEATRQDAGARFRG